MIETGSQDGARNGSNSQLIEWRQRVLEGRARRNRPPMQLREHVLYISGLITSLSIITAAAVWLGVHWAGLQPRWHLAILLVLTGIYLADLISGILHWAFDTWFDETAPFLQMVLPVREHHIHPQRILLLSFYENVGIASWQSVVLTGPGILVLLTLVPAPSLVHFSIMMVSLVTSIGLLLMFVLHQQAHRFGAPRWVQILRLLRLILNPRRHLTGHHRGNHDQDYCLVNGWVDNTIGKIGFWRALERLVSTLTGAVPRRDDELWLQQFNRGPKIQPIREK